MIEVKFSLTAGGLPRRSSIKQAAKLANNSLKRLITAEDDMDEEESEEQSPGKTQAGHR